MPSLGTSLGMIRDERLLALAVVTPKRSPLLPDVKKQMEAIDFIPAPTTPEEFDNIMRAMLVTFDEVARAAGLKAP